MDNKETYNKNSGYGENTKLEMDVIKNLFGDRLVNIEPITDKERQVQGIDYIVTYKDNNGNLVTKNVDVKLHHYNSEIFVFEYDDDRPNYNGRTWTNGEKLTDLVIWIMPGCNKYTLYSEESLIEFKNSMKWNFFNNEEFMNVKHWNKYTGSYEGKTYNKWLPLNFTTQIGKRSISYKMDMSGYGCKIKESKFKYNELTQTFSYIGTNPFGKYGTK